MVDGFGRGWLTVDSQGLSGMDGLRLKVYGEGLGMDGWMYR